MVEFTDAMGVVMLLLKALSGSRLYGTNGPNSDWDWIYIYDHMKGRRPKQIIEGGQDSLHMSLSMWTTQLDKGTHQAVEAMLAPAICCPVNLLADYRRAYKLNIPNVVNTYQRTIKAMKTNLPKQRMHARRLQINLDDLLEYGTFNPRLTKEQLSRVMG